MANGLFKSSNASAGALSSAQVANSTDIKTASLFNSQQKQVEEQRKIIDEYYAAQNAPKDNGGFFGGIGYAFEKLGLGFLQSIEGIWDYTAGGLADLFGAHDWAEKQIANDWVNYGHADEWFNPSDGWKVAGDVAGGIGTSLPAIATVAVAAAITYFSGGTLAPAAAGLIGGVVAGLGAAGTATKEAYKETGTLSGKEWGYGTLSGFTEGAMEGVSDAIGFGVGSIVKNLAGSTAKEGAKQVGKQIAKSAARQTFGKTVLKSFLSEAFEEGVQELIDPVWKRITYDPNAESATFQQVAYAALVGGLSGAIMGGADVTVRNSINYFSGSKTTANGGAQGVIDLATTIAETEGVNQSGNAQVDFVVNTLSELQESLKTTNGEVKTAKQKMLVGILSKANTAAPLSIVVHQNADAIIADAETTVKRLNDIGYKTSKGEAVTVEMLKQGVTGERGTTEYRRSLSQAMKTNEALRSVAVMSAAGQLNMDAARFQQSTLRGEQLFNQSDLNHFVETATEQQKRDVGERLGIADWATVTADELKSRIVEFSTNGGLDQYINERNEVKKLTELEISKKGLPKYVGSIKQDGAVRYKFGDASVAIVKNGDTYLVYDYANDIASKPLTKTEANRVIKEIYAASVQSATDSDVQTKAQQETQQLDAFARENVPDYKNLVGAQQQAVRQTLRQARAAGVSEADQILYASVAARSGVNIEFVSAEALGANADAGYSLKNGKILVNREMANNPKSRTAAKILLHEFTHGMIHRGYSVKGKKGNQHIENKVLNDFFTTAIKGLSTEQQIEILTPYVERHGVKMQDFLDGKVDLSVDTYIELREELAAHFVERELGNSAALKRIISDKPSFKDKLLSFLKRSKSDYSSNEKLSRAANALLKKYQAFFNKYATQNRFSPTITGDTSAYQTTEAADAQTRLSIKKINGKDVVVIDTDQHIFDGVERAAMGKTVRSYMKERYRGRSVNGTAFTAQSEREYTHSRDSQRLYNQTDGAYEAKMRASTELNNIIQTGELIGQETAKHPQTINEGGVKRYKVSFVLDGKAFNGEMIIAIDKSGVETFYDVVKIKESESSNNAPDGAVRTNAPSTDIISNNEENVNPDSKKSGKKRYALTVDGENITGEVEQTKNLVALHNLSETSLLKVLQLGGFPMPSIAITKVDMGHSEYGDITVVFGRDTIDPANPANKVYERDAWTPTVPRAEYKINENKAQEVIKRLTPYVNEYGGADSNIRRFLTVEAMQDSLNNNDGDIAYDFAYNYETKYAFLRETGIINGYAAKSEIDTEITARSKEYKAWLDELFENIADKKGVRNRTSEFAPSGARRSFEETHYDYTLNNIVNVMRNAPAQGTDTSYASTATLAAALAKNFSSIEDIKQAEKMLSVKNRKQISAARNEYEHAISEIVDEMAGRDIISQEGAEAVLMELARSKRITPEAILSHLQKEYKGIYNFNAETAQKISVLFNALSSMQTDMFEAKPRRAVELSEIKRVLIPSRHPNQELLQALKGKNIPYTLYEKSFDEHTDERAKIISQMDDVRFALAETDSDARALTDEQRKFFQNSKITDSKGRLLVLYHQTDADFTVFDVKRDGAGMRDNETPHGIFMKPNADDIGLKGSKQMPLYANIQNPLMFSDRTQAQRYWRANIEGYAPIVDEIAANDTKYNAEFEEAFDLERVARRKNLDWKKLNESQQDSLFWESDRETERILKEWKTANTALDKQAKKLIDEYLKKSGYDGVVVEHDAGSMGRSVKTIIALESNQVKSISNSTPTKSSDIRYALNTADTQYDRFRNVKEARNYYDNAIAEAYKRYKEVDPFSFRESEKERQAFNKYLSELATLEQEKAAAVKAVKKMVASTDSEGRALTPKQRKWGAGTKVVDADGHIKPVYHGTGAQFNEFSYDYLGKNGTSYGKGFYFSDSAEYSSGYVNGDGRLMEVYLSIKKPLNTSKLTMSKAQVRSFLSALSKYKTEDGINPLSDYADIDSYGVNSAINAALELEYDSNNNDVDIVHSIFNSISGIELQDYYKILKYTLGYDGIIEHRDSENFYIIFASNQAKDVTNTAPTQSADIRYAINPEPNPDTNPTESDNSGAIGGLTRGQRAKFVANNTKFKVYSKLDATSVIDSIIAERLTLRDGQYEGVLSGKNRAEVIEKLFTKLNSTPEGYRIGVALDIADYIINNAVLTDMYETYNDDSYAMGVLSIMRHYMHGMDLSGIQSEIQYKFDRKNSINLVWGAKKDGIAPDVVAQELEGYGIHIEAINEAEQFFEMLELYERAREQVNQKAEKIMLTAIGSKTEIEQLRQKIARDVLLAYDKKGTPSKYAKLVEQYTKKIADLKKDLSTAYKRNTLTNRIIDGAAYLRDIANKRNYVGAEIFAAPELTQWLKQLSKIKYRSDLRKTGVRKILLDYGLFYNTNNALLYDENPDLSYIDNNVIDALNFIRQNALSTKPLSMEELQAAEIIIASAKHLFNNYDQIIIEGKKAKISELATEGNEIIKKSKNRTNKTFFNKIYGVFNKIIEPRVVIKSLENFNPNGILTRAYAEVTRGETEAGLLYIELTNDIDTYIKKHKRFKNRLTSEYITVAGAELTVGQAISLYELSKRTQAQEGLYESGFSYIDKKGSKQTAHITEADITAMYDAFTDTDKGFIELVETFFNVASKQVKADADMQILGYTNASDEFYYPIKRDSGTIAKNITDARSIMADWANVYNFSFNKDVKTGAQNKLFVTDVYSIVTRHAKQLSTYAKMTVPLKNFSQIYAKNIGDKTNVVSIRNTINEQVWSGAEGYLSKLFSDIQGRATSNSIIEKMRGAYAKYQLGANLKVIVSQITSYPTAGIMLDSGVMAKGFVMRTNWAAMDKYCPYARVRNYERGIVRAEGVVDKIGKVGDVLTKPIQWTDRFTIGRLWNACQLQVQKDTGLKYGTVENMQKAGDMLEEVIRLTQPNYTNTERSELMRSDSDIVRSFTMFTSVPLKQLSRLVESFGEYNALRSLIKSGDSDPTLSKRYKLAKKKIRRTLASVTIANLMYVLVGQFFKFLYNNMAEDDEEGKVTAKSFFLDMLKDFGSTTIGMLPVVRDIYGYFVNGYEIESFTGDMLNSIISSAKSLFELATKAASGEGIKTQEYMSIFRNSLYSIGQVTGIPVRNINNTITGLVRRFSPSAAYAYTSLFYNPKYSTDIKAALKKGDYELAEMIMGMLLKDDRTGSLSSKATQKLIELYDAGYTVLPKSIGNTLTYNGETIQLTAAQQSAFKTIYSQANAEIEKLVNSAEFATLPAERQAKAIKLLYDAYYSKAQASVLKLANDNKIILLSGAISPSTLALHLSAISAIESDTDKAGNVINGSKKTKVIKYVMAQKLATVQKLLLILSLGYTIKDGDIRGISALKAKRTVARYITNLSISKEEKTALAEKCGLTVKNGRIYAK